MKDLSEKQFNDALKKKGFAPYSLGWGWCDKTGAVSDNIIFMGVIRMDGTYHRRLTIRSLVADRNKEQRKQTL